MASKYLKWKDRDVQPDEPVRLTARPKRANWWHYHKWYVVLGAVLLAVLVNLVFRGLGLWEIKPDYQVAYVGSEALPEDTVTALETALAGLGTDCNSDGRVVVQVNQYILGRNAADGDAAMYAYADSTKLMADLDSCDSYFFLLEAPETFQENYQVLRRLDGSLPAGSDWNYGSYCLSWVSCPALSSLPLGEYSETFLGQEFSGDNQERLCGLSLARRGFWTDKTVKHADECDVLWDTITKGALS